MSIKNFFSEIEKEQIVQAIKAAEFNTSGEVRIHLESKCSEDPFIHGTKVFNQLEMYKTELRNGVLFYMAVKDKKFAIIGDEGIDKVVPDDFWDCTRDVMLELFKKGEFAKGLIQGIQRAGEKLKEFFPYQSDDINELSDEISFGEESSND
jgi:uncharacterized membrane protein